MTKIRSCSDNITDHNATAACFEHNMLLPEWPHAGPYPAPCFGSFGIRRILKQLVFIHNYIVQGQLLGAKESGDNDGSPRVRSTRWHPQLS